MEQITDRHIKGYEVRERLGTGGFGAVYRAYQSTVGREVAIKVILPGIANHPDFIRRFEVEAQVIARLEHLHIVPLYDYWRDPEGAYLVMRWLKGGSLRDALANGAFELEVAVLLIDQISAALDAAHRNGIIHRDLKPANILMDEDGNAYLADFGIAKDLTSVNGSNTAEDIIVGSLDYISPEQARSEPVTARTDIYSLGVVLYEILKGEHPFPNRSPVERLYHHLNDPLPRLEHPTVPLQVNDVIQKATAKNPAERFSDSLAFAAAFRQAVIRSGQQPSSDPTELLTLREHEILLLLIQGLSNKEIAHKLTFTHGTVKWYINQIYKKLQVRSRVQAIIRARELNLINTIGLSDDLPTALATMPLPTSDFQPENPYKGLRAFKAADHDDYFGQEKLIEKLLKRLSEPTEASRFLAVIGPSGSGKSSLIKAGLIPALWRGELAGSERWFVADMLPGSRPLDELEVALIRVAANQSGAIKEQLQRDKYGLLRVAQIILPDDGSDLLIVIDQFEEAFTLLEEEATRAHFLALIHTAVTDPRSRVRVIITLRADFYDRPLHYPDFGELIRNRMETLLPLSADGLERAIRRPAERVGVTFEEGLVASIIQEIHYQPGALPLLQYALTELFEQRQGRLLTHEAYQTIGKAIGALAKRAEQLYSELAPDLQAVARQLFLRLVTLGEGVEDTRRRVARSELLAITPETDRMDEVIDTFATYRLLSLDHDPATRIPTVEVAHEAILREWERLRQWLNESRADIRVQRQLSAAAHEWHQAGEEASFLARGSRLQLFEEWIANTPLALTPKETSFVQASLKQRHHEQLAERERQAREAQLEQRSQAFLRGLVAVFAVAAITAGGLSMLAFSQRNDAQNARATSEANAKIIEENAVEIQELALLNGAQAAFANHDLDTARALSLVASQTDHPSNLSQLWLAQVAYAPGTVHIYRDEMYLQDWNEAILSPDEQHLITLNYANSQPIIWDLASGKVTNIFPTTGVSAMAFRPNNWQVLVAYRDGALTLWDFETLEASFNFSGQTAEIWTVAFNPDGNYFASGSVDGQVLVWDIATGNLIHTLEAHREGVTTIAFSPDGKTLLTAALDKTIAHWDMATGELLGQFSVNMIPTALIFNHDGTQFVVSSSPDFSMYLWDIQRGEAIQDFGGAGPIHDPHFSVDGQTVFAAGGNNIVFWNLESGTVEKVLGGHSFGVSEVIPIQDENRLLSVSRDGTIRLWDLRDGAQLVTSSLPNLGNDGAISPDGKTFVIASGGGDLKPELAGRVILFDAETGETIRYFGEDNIAHGVNSGNVNVRFSPDGQFVLSSAWNGEIKLWDAHDGRLIHRYEGVSSQINSIQFAPDGFTFIAATEEGEVLRGDVNSGEIIHRYPLGAPVKRAIFTSDGRQMLACLANETANILLINLEDGQTLSTFATLGSPCFALAFAPNLSQFVSGHVDGHILLWDLTSAEFIQQFIGNLGRIMELVFTPDGQTVISGSHQRGAGITTTLTLWDVATGEPYRHYAGHQQAVNVLDLTPDGSRMLSVAYDGMAKLWRVDDFDTLVEWIYNNRYIRKLTCEERTLYRLAPLCSD